ncbi:hypothetical protein PGT21_028819 [Puccinia graminis f. sp. tritici]|uniref:Uncharacterized protein n=1 Tax=Puccinia graminis f. sp. tritici TaxID=56615 RepID=A0A5B0N9L2_PUCGR|nr:hypothetical protein PGT21_028819 [Puccinia graminis f. sp. tritici]
MLGLRCEWQTCLHFQQIQKSPTSREDHGHYHGPISQTAILYVLEYGQFQAPAAKDNLLKQQYKYDNSRAFGKDLWRFNYYSDAAGARIYFKFEKNRTNKGGKIYKVAAGQPSEFVGQLRSQLRYDKWLDPVKGTKTFTLSCIDGAPLVCA